MSRLLFAISFCGLVSTGTAQGQEAAHWVATWGTSPLLAVENLPPLVEPEPEASEPAPPEDSESSPIPPVPEQLNNNTVRMIVRTSIGGESLRLQFSNAQGTEPLSIGAVHVAVHASGSTIVANTDREVTFNGENTVTIHPGALVVSDPVGLPIPALTELAISIYLPERTDTSTRHELGLNTTWIAAGNVVSAVSLSPTETNRSYFWLTGVEVQTTENIFAIVAYGDSITDGFATTPDTHRAWPSLLAARLQQDASTSHLGVLNMGISGNRVLRNGAGASALSRFDRDVLARASVSWMILMEGINDITFSALPGIPDNQRATAREIIEGLSQLVDRAHAHGLKVMGATLTPMGGLWLYNEETEGMRQEVNDWLRSNDKIDALVDFDMAIRDPEVPEQLKPEYDSGDHIHPNDAGNVAMAAAIDTADFIP